MTGGGGDAGRVFHFPRPAEYPTAEYPTDLNSRFYTSESVANVGASFRDAKVRGCVLRRATGGGSNAHTQACAHPGAWRELRQPRQASSGAAEGQPPRRASLGAGGTRRESRFCEPEETEETIVRKNRKSARGSHERPYHGRGDGAARLEPGARAAPPNLTPSQTVP